MPRHLHGEGEFVADIRLPGTRDVAFVRSPLAHARVRGVRKPAGREADVFAAADLEGVSPIYAPSALPGFKRSRQPVFAAERVRHVGEILAACVADDRAAAEDLAEAVALDLEELPAVHDRAAGAGGGGAAPARRVGRQRVPRIGDRGGPRADSGRGRGIRYPHLPHRPPVHVAPRGPRGARIPRSPPGHAGGPDRLPDAPHRAERARGVPRDRAGPHPGGRPRRGRRLRVQGDPPRRRGVPRLARDALPAPGAVDRGSARAAHRERQLPRAPLRHHRPCGGGRTPPRDRVRGPRRRRRLLRLPVLGRPRTRPGGQHSPGALRLRGIPLPHVGDGDQQAPHPALPGGGAHRGVLRARGAARRDGPRARPGPGRVPAPESRPAGADAVRQHHRQALRQRGLPGVPAAGRRGAGPSLASRRTWGP